MKIGVTSDIHLEFGDLDLPNKDGIDVLILGGDIAVASKMGKFVPFFERVSKEFPQVIYIMGNHEHYKGLFDRTEIHIRDDLEHLKNVHVLEKSLVKLGDVNFIGQTLWTDFNKYDPITMMHCQMGMNDYHSIRFADQNYRSLTPTDTAKEFDKSVSYLGLVLAELKDEKCVVVGHHAPSHKSVKPRYEHDYLLNGAYRSNLEEFIEDHPQIALWTHGHTHNNFDYMVGSTRVVCNPRGYWGVEIHAPGYTYQIVEV